ncbi:hypothetical protein ACHAO7_010765 [Fusarium culmorum]
MPTSPYPLLDTLQLFYDTEAHLLICTRESCKFALSNAPSQVVAHLRDKHHVPTEARKGLHRLLKSLSPTLLDPHRAPLPADGSARHDKLPVYEGFVCLNCPFRTISTQLARRHQSNPPEDCSSGISHTRAVRRRDLDQQFECVYLQTWTTGSTRRYWIIKHRGSIVRQVDSPAVQAHLRSVLTREFNRGKVPNEMTAAPPVAPADIASFALQTPWLDRTGWDQTYNNKDRREVLVALTRTFTAPGGREHYIGPGQQYEDKIACLIRLADLLICRCEETARKTSRHILCWLRSTKNSSIYSKPFTLVQPSSSTKYRLLLKRCLAMVLRIHRLPPDKRLQVTGLTLNRKQLQFLDAIWRHDALRDLTTLEELAGRYKRSAGHTQATAGLGVRGQTTDEEVGDNYEEEESEEDETEDEEDEEEVDIDDPITYCPRSEYFEVDPEARPAEVSDQEVAIKDFFKNRSLIVQKDANMMEKPDQFTQPSPWLDRVGCVTHLQGFADKKDFLRGLISLDLDLSPEGLNESYDFTYLMVFKVLDQLIWEAQGLIYRQEVPLNARFEVARYDLNTASRKPYASTLKQLIVYTLRCLDLEDQHRSFVDDISQAQMEAFISTPGCRRAVISAFMDGVASETCKDINGAALCDRCELLQRDDDSRETEGDVDGVIEGETEGETEREVSQDKEGESESDEMRKGGRIWKAFGKEEGMRIKTLFRWLDDVAEECPVCHVRRHQKGLELGEVPDQPRHKKAGQWCEMVAEEGYDAARKAIRFKELSCCFICKLPLDWCQETQDEEGKCIYKDKLLPVVLMGLRSW